jgi:hypothetical protein
MEYVGQRALARSVIFRRSLSSQRIFMLFTAHVRIPGSSSAGGEHDSPVCRLRR